MPEQDRLVRQPIKEKRVEKSRKPKYRDEYTLYDLKVTVIHRDKSKDLVCKHKIGDFFTARGEMLRISGAGGFSFYALSSILPFLAAKQRPTQNNDWMTTDALIACPDPHCGAGFMIEKIGKRVERHSEATKVPLPAK